jgi:quercetin dioxygenase-like cupin family protein
MITARIDELELRKGWSEAAPDVAFNFGLAVSKANGTTSSQVVCVTLEPGKSGGRHIHSAEEILFVVEGTAQLAVGNDRERFGQGDMALIPAAIAHEAINIGSERLRFLAIFPSAMVVHTWDVPVEPTGERIFVTPPTER